MKTLKRVVLPSMPVHIESTLKALRGHKSHETTEVSSLALINTSTVRDKGESS